jgi:hypothetical protein
MTAEAVAAWGPPVAWAPHSTGAWVAAACQECSLAACGLGACPPVRPQACLASMVATPTACLDTVSAVGMLMAAVGHGVESHVVFVAGVWQMSAPWCMRSKPGTQTLLSGMAACSFLFIMLATTACSVGMLGIVCVMQDTLWYMLLLLPLLLSCRHGPWSLSRPAGRSRLGRTSNTTRRPQRRRASPERQWRRTGRACCSCYCCRCSDRRVRSALQHHASGGSDVGCTAV